MRILFTLTISVCLIANLLPSIRAEQRDLGHETLDANDGWASLTTGTTGGSNAATNQIYTVHNRRELVAALNNGVYPPPSSNPSNVSKIIYVDGTIDANVDDNNQPLTCTDYQRNGYTLEAYLAAYDPAVWGRVLPSGPLEAARVASQQAQQARVRIRVGSNTTIVGVGKNSLIRGAWFDIRGTAGVANRRTNIIIRNLTFADTFDCFRNGIQPTAVWETGTQRTIRFRCEIPITSGSITTPFWTRKPLTVPCRHILADYSRCMMERLTSPTPLTW